MSTPDNAPYKERQRENDLRLRESRSFRRFNRERATKNTKLALGVYLNPQAPMRERQKARAFLKATVPALTRAERQSVGLRPGAHVL